MEAPGAAVVMVPLLLTDELPVPLMVMLPFVVPIVELLVKSRPLLAVMEMVPVPPVVVKLPLLVKVRAVTADTLRLPWLPEVLIVPPLLKPRPAVLSMVILPLLPVLPVVVMVPLLARLLLALNVMLWSPASVKPAPTPADPETLTVMSPPNKLNCAPPVFDWANDMPVPLPGVMLKEPPLVDMLAEEPLGATKVIPTFPPPLSKLNVALPCAVSEEPASICTSIVLSLTVPPP